MISPSSTNPRVTEMGNYIFRVCFIDPFQGAVLAKFALTSLHAKRAAILTSVNNAYSVGISKVFREKFTAAGGEIVAEQRHSEGDKDFRAQLTAIKAAGADVIFHSSNYTEGALICIQARQLGFTGPIFGGDAWEAPQLIEIGGAAVEGTYYSTHASPDSTAPEVQNFVKKFRARWDSETPDSIAASATTPPRCSSTPSSAPARPKAPRCATPSPRPRILPGSPAASPSTRTATPRSPPSS